jgi:glycosyltransferase involved in cell wall biosynthesis
VSLVIICYQMDRELPRTVASLTPSYQRGVDAGRIEIIVVDNGSLVPPAADAYRDLDVQLRVLFVAEPTASPVRAINLGLEEARADLIGVWIDGARLASPGLIRACLRASELHPRPVIATLNYQLGPSLQYLSVQHGYGTAAEDALLDGIGWPADG